MKCIIPGTELKIFGKCIHCLAKLGDEIFIETSNSNSLILKTVNSARSGFACFEFNRNFFSSFKTSGAKCCKIFSKSIMSVFKGLPTLEKSVDFFTFEFDEKRDKIVFVFHCKYGIKKTHRLGFEDCEALKAIFTKDSSPNMVSHCSRPLQEALSSFNSSVTEVTLSITQSSLQLSNYVEPDHEDSGRVLKSAVTLYPDEFNVFRTQRDTLVTFCLKELRAILALTGSLLANLALQFDCPGNPVIFSMVDDPNYSADFVLATLLDPEESENSQTLSQAQSHPLPNDPPSSTTQPSNVDVSVPNSEPSIETRPPQLENESINLNNVINSPPHLDIGSDNGFHDNNDMDDFVTHKESHSHDVQESILESSSCLPATPPPKKDSVSILASDSDSD